MALLPTVRLADLQQGRSIVDKEGRPSTEFLTHLNGNTRNIRVALLQIVDFVGDVVELNNLITAAQTAIADANTAIAAAEAATETVTAEQSLNASSVANFTPPMISSDSAGNVTIANHDRVYGNATLNPTVAVTGGVIATGQANPAIVHIFYSQPSRAGGSVTYQWSLDQTDAAQTGSVHSVGSVAIPAAGTQSGGYVRPPGYARFDEVEP